MSDSKSQQTGNETADASIRSTTGTSSHNSGSPETEAAVPQIVVRPASNQDDDEIPPASRRLARRPPSLLLSSGNFLEVPRSPRPTNQRTGPHRRSSSQARIAFGPRNIPLSLTGPADAFHVAVDPLRMHPTGLTSSSTMPAATANHGGPLALRYDGNPYTPQGREVMAKVEKMLAASKALKPETEAAPGGGSKFAWLRKKGFFKKLRSPSFPVHLFSKSKPREAPKTHQIRHIVSLDPLPPPGRITRVPSPRLRQNERVNLQKREKALWVLGDIPRFSGHSASAPPLPSSAEDPFSESPREATRTPTAFETRLRATKSEGTLLSRAAMPDPFKTDRIMASNHDSLLPDPPSDSSTPLRNPGIPFSPRGVVSVQENPTQPPTTPTNPTIATTPAPAPTTPPIAATPGSTRASRQSRSSSHPDMASGGRPDQRQPRPCADAGPDEDAGGHTALTTTPTTTASTANANTTAAVTGTGVVAAVPRFALAPRLHPRAWVWPEEEKEGVWWEEQGPRREGETKEWWEEEEVEEEEEEVQRGTGRAAEGWWEEEEEGDDDEGERERRAWERRGGMLGFGFGGGHAAGRQLRDRFPCMGTAEADAGEVSAPDAAGAGLVAAGPFSLGRGTFGGSASASVGVGEEGAGATAEGGASEAGLDPLVWSRPASEGEKGG
ncbi:uncharacterized protein B0H64DRAFT_450009 [Chaetomium fimeti]|uniref:Uncharacterized protein n=1 Tax=Chaetomium fimeti TaxID=1854472 RepID=A0AAE0HRX3_9PEZI|nr:hypothetical protein B0H64DRAFT_450009 [Chaetomium fimeti]